MAGEAGAKFIISFKYLRNFLRYPRRTSDQRRAGNDGGGLALRDTYRRGGNHVDGQPVVQTRLTLAFERHEAATEHTAIGAEDEIYRHRLAAHFVGNAIELQRERKRPRLHQRRTARHTEAVQRKVIDRQALAVDLRPETDAPPTLRDETLTLAALADGSIRHSHFFGHFFAPKNHQKQTYRFCLGKSIQKRLFRLKDQNQERRPLFFIHLSMKLVTDTQKYTFICREFLQT